MLKKWFSSFLTQVISLNVAANNHPAQECWTATCHTWSRQNERISCWLAKFFVTPLSLVRSLLNTLRKGDDNGGLYTCVHSLRSPSVRSVQAIHRNTRWWHLFGKFQNVSISGIPWLHHTQNLLSSSSASQESTDFMLVWLWAVEVS